MWLTADLVCEPHCARGSDENDNFHFMVLPVRLKYIYARGFL